MCLPEESTTQWLGAHTAAPYKERIAENNTEKSKARKGGVDCECQHQKVSSCCLGFARIIKTGCALRAHPVPYYYKGVFLLYKCLLAVDDVDAGNGDSLNLTACDVVDNLCSVLLNSILDVLNAGCATPVRVVALLYLHNQPIIYQFAAKYKKIYNITRPAGKILFRSVFWG